MALVWHLLEANLGETNPWTANLGHTGVRALVVSVHDPDQANTWRAAEHGEQRSRGALPIVFLGGLGPHFCCFK